MTIGLFTEEQEAFARSVRKYATSRLASGYMERARSDHFFWDVYRDLGRQGLLSLAVTEEGGGQGASLTDIGIACEEMARGDFNVGFSLLNAAVQAGLLEKHLQSSLREKWLPGLMSGELLTGLALTEPGSGSDAAAMRTTATRVDGGWLLNGEKTSISLAMHAHAVEVFAKTSTDIADRGVTAFFVPLNSPGITRHPLNDLGWRPVGRASVNFDDTFVSDEQVMGEVGRGFNMVMHEFDYTRPLLGLLAIGAAESAIDLTIGYAKQRTAFGQPIGKYEGVSFPLVEHRTHIAGIRALSYRTLSLRMANLPHTQEAAMIKWWAPQEAVRAIHDCIVLHGHVAYSEDLPLQQMLRDVSGLEIGDGTPQIQKMIIAREMLGREYLPYSRVR